MAALGRDAPGAGATGGGAPMMAAFILVVSLDYAADVLCFLLPFADGFFRAATRSLSEVRDVTGIPASASSRDFARVMQLLHLCPERPDDRTGLQAVELYYGILGLLEKTVARIVAFGAFLDRTGTRRLRQFCGGAAGPPHRVQPRNPGATGRILSRSPCYHLRSPAYIPLCIEIRDSGNLNVLLLTGVRASAAQNAPVNTICSQCGSVLASGEHACNFCDSTEVLLASGRDVSTQGNLALERSCTRRMAW